MSTLIDYRSAHDYTCYICYRSFRVEYRPQIHHSIPPECPYCTAPIKRRDTMHEDYAKIFILHYYATLSAVDWANKLGAGLSEFCETEQEIEDLLKFIENLDFDEWEAEERREFAIVQFPQFREAIQARLVQLPQARLVYQEGYLVPAMRQVAERVKEQKRQEREHYLAIYRQKRSYYK